jgi:hypothetical protein
MLVTGEHDNKLPASGRIRMTTAVADKRKTLSVMEKPSGASYPTAENPKLAFRTGESAIINYEQMTKMNAGRFVYTQRSTATVNFFARQSLANSSTHG